MSSKKSLQNLNLNLKKKKLNNKKVNKQNFAIYWMQCKNNSWTGQMVVVDTENY